MKHNAKAQNGTPIYLNTNSYKIKTTKYIRNAEPIMRERTANPEAAKQVLEAAKSASMLLPLA